jgi:hypothetical protein
MIDWFFCCMPISMSEKAARQAKTPGIYIHLQRNLPQAELAASCISRQVALETAPQHPSGNRLRK